MRLEDFDYHLPEELIAQEPAEPRDSSRLLYLHKATGEIEHHVFRELPDLLAPRDALVLNDTRVLRARLHGRREATGGRVEILLLRPLEGETWQAMARPTKRLHEGERIELEGGPSARLARKLVDGTVELELPEEVSRHLDSFGEMPLPPYIHSYRGDPERYQTVYAHEEGSVAAPTAGLHFTPQLLDALRARGVELEVVTLHVGAGTFQPVKTERIEEHRMHSERYFVPEGLLARLRDVRKRGGRVIAVGTTSARTLESVAARPETEGEWSETDLFIRPGYEWRLVDGLITNFHLPRSTLLMLVSALVGRDAILTAYHVAVERRYRFYSFGDAMLIL